MPKSYEERKAAWAEKMKARMASREQAMKVRSEDRLPPGQHLTTGFPVLDLGIKPKIATADWSLELAGLAENPTNLDWESLNALPQTTDTSDFHCVTTWSKFNCEWGRCRVHGTAGSGQADRRGRLRALHRLRRLHHQHPGRRPLR